MFKEKSPESDRGQVGIGTLIVFIALVLVAAIAAGVLINTAGFLQSQAEQTGQESTDQVSNNIQLVTASGVADEAAQEYDSVEADIQLSPGSDAVTLFDEDADASAVEIEIFGSDLDAPAADGDFSENRLEDGETATLDFGGLIVAGDDAEVVITTEDGSQTTFNLVAPDPVSTDDDGDRIRLS